ncbi:MAG: hypothetical protein ACLU80_14935 [Dorea sp.]
MVAFAENVETEWKSVINARVKGTVCPVCAETEVLAGYNDLATTDQAAF